MASFFYYWIKITILFLCFAQEFMSIEVKPDGLHPCPAGQKADSYKFEGIESCIEGKPISLKYSPKIRADYRKNWKPSKRFALDNICKDNEKFCCLDVPYAEAVEGKKAASNQKVKFSETQEFGGFLNDHKNFWFIIYTFDAEYLKSATCDFVPTTTTMTTAGAETTEQIESTPTTSSTIETTTSVDLELIKCADPKWVSVRVAEVTDISKDDIRTVQDYAAHVGYEQFNRNNSLSDAQIRGKVNQLMHDLPEAANNVETKKEIQQWLEENKDWLTNLKIGEFRYVRVNGTKLYRDEKNKQRTTMLMYNCDFGNFLVAPVKKQPNMDVGESKLDWSNEFYHLEQCVVKSFDMTAHLHLKYRISTTTRQKNFEDINLKVGLEIKNPGLQFEPSCEAFKYKYGYSDPLREPSLNDTTNNYDRVRKFGHYLLPIDEVCNPPKGYTLSAEMWQFRRDGLLKDYATRVRPTEEGADCDQQAVCLKCNIQNCHPTLEWSLLQPAVFECNGFTFWTPRVKSLLKYTVVDLNGQSITIEHPFVAKTYYLEFKKIEVPTSIEEYKLYENMENEDEE